MNTKRIVRWGIVLFLLLALPGLTGALAQGQAQSPAAVNDCDKTVGATQSDFTTINAALNFLRGLPNSLSADYDVICVRDGIYNEKVAIVDDTDNISEIAGLTLKAYPDGDEERPIIDGAGLYFQDWFSGLVSIKASNVHFEGFEVQNSYAKGIVIGTQDSKKQELHDVSVVDVSVHGSWADGIITPGDIDDTNKQPTNIVVRNSEVYDNGLKARYMPVVFEGRRAANETNANAWQFLSGGLDPVNAPFWQGKYRVDPHDGAAGSAHMSYFPHEDLDAIAAVVDTQGRLVRMLVSTPPDGQEGNPVKLKGRTIPASHTVSGTVMKFYGLDILEFHQDTGKWSKFFDGSSVFTSANSSCKNLNLDGFELTGDGRLLLSFDFLTSDTCSSLSLPGVGQVYPSDLLVYSNGQYAYYAGNYSQWGLTKTENLLDFAFDPSGNLVAKIEKATLSAAASKNLYYFKPSSGSTPAEWVAYMNAELKYRDSNDVHNNEYQFNPLSGFISAVSIGGNIAGETRLYIGGEVEGAVGLGFKAVGSGMALNNRVYGNYGEGLSLYFNAQNMILYHNIIYDSLHTNLYVNDVQTATIDSNFVYCTDDWRYWGMPGNDLGYNSGNGIANRDEKLGGKEGDPNSGTHPSSNLSFTNNIVVGCNSNFLIVKMDDSVAPFNQPIDGLKVIHNSFVTARAEAGGGSNVKVANVTLYGAKNPSYVNSVFANNLIAQWPLTPAMTPTDPCGLLIVSNQCKPPAGLTMKNNLYQHDPPAAFLTEPGKQIGDPLLVGPKLPEFGKPVPPTHYQLRSTASPAYNNGAPFSGIEELEESYFRGPRDDGYPDIGADELQLNHLPGSITLGDKVTSDVAHYPETNWNGASVWNFHMDVPGYIMADLKKTSGLGHLDLSLWRVNPSRQMAEIETAEGLLFQSLYAGDYYFVVSAVIDPADPGNYADLEYEMALSSPLLISAAAADLGGGGVVAGIHFYSQDILAFSRYKDGEERWRMFFEGKDVGLIKNVTNVAAGDPNHPGRILFSLGNMQHLPGVGTVTPNDILVFDPIQYGPTTIGTFGMGLDGSARDVKLTMAGERLDGLDGWVFGYQADPTKYGCFGFPVSTVGIVRVDGWGNLKVVQDNEDVFCKVYDEAAGGWRPWDWFFDVDGSRNQPPNEGTAGDVPGLAGRNVFALSYNDPEDIMYLTIRGSGEIDGHEVTQMDIFAIDFPSYEWAGILWHGPDHGWNYKIDAFEWDGW
jgi:hypothetical protein